MSPLKLFSYGNLILNFWTNKHYTTESCFEDHAKVQLSSHFYFGWHLTINHSKIASCFSMGLSTSKKVVFSHIIVQKQHNIKVTCFFFFTYSTQGKYYKHLATKTHVLLKKCAQKFLNIHIMPKVCTKNEQEFVTRSGTLNTFLSICIMYIPIFYI